MDATTRELEKLVYSYRIASTDMKFIEVGTRDIYLRTDPDRGPVLRGEIPGCGGLCHANLTELFQEYAMSCKGFEKPDVMIEAVEHFGRTLGERVCASFITSFPTLRPEALLFRIFTCLASSMGVPYRVERTDRVWTCYMDESPLDNNPCSQDLQAWNIPAYFGFIALFRRVLKMLGAGWELTAPGVDDPAPCLMKVQLAAKQ